MQLLLETSTFISVIDKSRQKISEDIEDFNSSSYQFIPIGFNPTNSKIHIFFQIHMEHS